MHKLDQEKLDLLAAAATSAGTAVDGTAVDMSGFEGVIFFCSIATADAGNFLKAQGGATSGAATNDLEGSAVVAGANGDIVLLDIHKPNERFVRPVIIRAGADTATGEIYAIRYGARVKPVENAEAGVLVEVAIASPAQGTA